MLCFDSSLESMIVFSLVDVIVSRLPDCAMRGSRRTSSPNLLPFDGETIRACPQVSEDG